MAKYKTDNNRTGHNQPCKTEEWKLGLRPEMNFLSGFHSAGNFDLFGVSRFPTLSDEISLDLTGARPKTIGISMESLRLCVFLVRAGLRRQESLRDTILSAMTSCVACTVSPRGHCATVTVAETGNLRFGPVSKKTQKSFPVSTSFPSGRSPN